MSPRRALPPALYRKFPFLQDVLDGMNASVKVVDSNFNVVWANARARQDSGYDFPTLRGRPCHLYLNGFKDNCAWCPVVKALDDGKLHIHTFERETLEGKRRMEVTGYLLPAEKEGIRYAVEITRDVTDLVSGAAFQATCHFEAPPADAAPPPPERDLKGRLESVERHDLIEALRRARGDMTTVAREAGFSVKTLQRRLRKYGLDARDYKRRAGA